jgi:hypothetical protein
MQVHSGDRFYHNHTPREIAVTFEMRCADGGDAFAVEILDGEGASRGAASVPPGRTESHCFEVPPGGSLYCRGGQAECIWKGTTLAALLADRWRAGGSALLRIAR